MRQEEVCNQQTARQNNMDTTATDTGTRLEEHLYRYEAAHIQVITRGCLWPARLPRAGDLCTMYSMLTRLS